jgi:hypothetical protein
MKNLFLFLVLVMVGLVSNSQTPQYFYPEYVVLYVLDSLNVPYVPLPERYGVNPMGNKTETTAKGFSKHQNFFKNEEFVFIPTEDSPSTEWSEFFSNHKFLNDRDINYNNLYSNFGFDVVGFSKIPLKNGEFKSVEIIEYRNKRKDEFGTIALLEKNSGLFEFVDQYSHPLNPNWTVSFE